MTKTRASYLDGPLKALMDPKITGVAYLPPRGRRIPLDGVQLRVIKELAAQGGRITIVKSASVGTTELGLRFWFTLADDLEGRRSDFRRFVEGTTWPAEVGSR